MQVIFNADDFGKSSSINAAVLQAFEQGVLSSASLMVAGEAYDEAVDIAKNHPGLGVGLHLVVTNGKAILPPEEIPHLVDREGFFTNDPLLAGIKYFFHPATRHELGREISAQFQRFSETGLQLSHLDGHLHMHMHPTIFDTALPLAIEYGAYGIRLPRDDFWLAIRYDRRRVIMKVLWSTVFGLLARWAKRRLQDTSLSTVNKVYGLMQSGQMYEDYVLRVLLQLNVPSAELYFHPDQRSAVHAFGPNPNDLAALISDRMKMIVKETGIELATYANLTSSK